MQIDARGKVCPIPVIEAKKAIRQMQETGGELSVLVDNQPACENLAKMADGYGYTHQLEQQGKGQYCINITVTASQEDENSQKNAPAPMLPTNEASTATVAIGQDAMGHGSDELGKILIKGFIYSLSQLNPLPKAILFFNSGVHLTLADSNTLEDLQEMEKKGVTILVCGTCVDYYGVKEQVSVGEITNMYGIVEQMAAAQTMINL